MLHETWSQQILERMVAGIIWTLSPLIFYAVRSGLLVFFPHILTSLILKGFIIRLMLWCCPAFRYWIMNMYVDFWTFTCRPTSLLAINMSSFLFYGRSLCILYGWSLCIFMVDPYVYFMVDPYVYFMVDPYVYFMVDPYIYFMVQPYV